MLSPDPRETGGSANRPARILIVDDEPQVLVALQDLLEDDFEVEATDEPGKALRLVESDANIAVVVSDQRMPVMTGDELLARVRLRCSASRILCTGYADLQAVVRSVNEGRIFAYVTKPWDGMDLRLKIQHAADHFRLNHELAYEKQLLADLMNNIPDAIFFKDAEQRYIRVNPAFERGTARSFSDVIGKRFSDVMPEGDELAREIEERERELLLDGVARRDVLHHRVGPDKVISSATTRAAIRSSEGQIVGLVGVAQDISEVVRAQEALRQSEERLRLAFLAASTGLFDWNLVTGEVLYSPTSTLLSSTGPTPLDGINALESLVHPDDLGRLRQAIEAHLEHREPLRNLELRAKSERGEFRWFEVSAQAAWNEAGKPVRLVGSIADVTLRKEQQSRLITLSHQVLHDELTSLPNRAHFQALLEAELGTAEAREQRLALIVLDVVRFRHVHETLGRRGSDEILRELARRVAGTAPEQARVARLQNDGFAVLMPGVEHESDAAQWLQETFAPAMSQPFTIEDTELVVNLKAGIALYPSDSRSADGLLSNAEAALKQAKHSAMPYLFYAPSMNGRVAERLRLENKLRRALSNEEFLLHYQPKVALKSGEIVGMEALIRWRDPDAGIVAPGTFIPVLEETELILPVGRWVLRRAAEQVCEWRRLGHTVPRIAVNVSALQLAHPDFVAALDAVMKEFPGAAGGIDLELTESVLMDDLAGNVEKLRAVKERGLQVAIDDFGTGYSSLGYLSRLPLDALKIDRSFIDDMADDPQQMSIVTAIISLAHAMDLKVIAEGVETPTQAQLLRLLRCDQIQGYLLARPLPAEAVVEMLGERLEIPKPSKT